MFGLGDKPINSMTYQSHLFQIKPGKESIWTARCDKLNQITEQECDGPGMAKRRVVLTNYSVDGVLYCFGTGESLPAPTKRAAINRQHIKRTHECLDLVPIESAIFSAPGHGLFMVEPRGLSPIPLSNPSEDTQPRFWLLSIKPGKVEAWNHWCQEANKITARECQSPHDTLKRTLFTSYRQNGRWATLCRALDLDAPMKTDRMNKEFQELKAECTQKPVEAHFLELFV